jgi:hypothetical protein
MAGRILRSLASVGIAPLGVEAPFTSESFRDPAMLQAVHSHPFTSILSYRLDA